jgi:hypothetical protein
MDDNLQMVHVTLFHGTIHQEPIDKFWPNSHFGSRLASIDAISTKWIEEEVKKGMLPDILIVAPDKNRRIIEAELQFNPINCYLAEIDWGSPTVLGLCVMFKDDPKFEATFRPIHRELFNLDRELKIKNGEDEVAKKQSMDALHTLGIAKIMAALEPYEIKLIKYRNSIEGRLEGSEKEYSYCVLDTSLITINGEDPVSDIEFIPRIAHMLKVRYPERTFNIVPL